MGCVSQLINLVSGRCYVGVAPFLRDVRRLCAIYETRPLQTGDTHPLPTWARHGAFLRRHIHLRGGMACNMHVALP